MIEIERIRKCLEELSSKRIVFVTGKGGVGKSVFCVLLGRYASRAGKKTILIELDGRSAIRDIFSSQIFSREDPVHSKHVPKIGYTPVELEKDLSATDIDSEEAAVGYLSEFLGSQKFARMVMNNRIIKYFYEALPAGREIVVLNRLYKLITDPENKHDLFIIDMPSSGHAFSTLILPETAVGTFMAGPVVKRAARMAEVFFDAASSLLVMVSIPEEMSVAETMEFYPKFRDEIKIPMGPVIINMVSGGYFDDKMLSLYNTIVGKKDAAKTVLTDNFSRFLRVLDFDISRQHRTKTHVDSLAASLGRENVVEMPLCREGPIVFNLEKLVSS